MGLWRSQEACHAQHPHLRALDPARSGGSNAGTMLARALRRLRVFLLRPGAMPLCQHALLAWPLALLPSLLLLAAAMGVLLALGLDPRASGPLYGPTLRQVTAAEFAGAVILAPLVETPLLGLSLAVLGRWIRRRGRLLLAAALLWGLLHGAQAPLWFVGSARSFAVLAGLYRAWRPRSFAHAYLVAGLPHALINLSAMLAIMSSA